jgi:hypothetical protein
MVPSVPEDPFKHFEDYYGWDSAGYVIISGTSANMVCAEYKGEQQAFDHSVTGTYTAKAKGLYRISASCDVYSTNTGAYQNIANIYINTTGQKYGQNTSYQFVHSSGKIQFALYIENLIALQVGQTFLAQASIINDGTNPSYMDNIQIIVVPAI